MKKNWISSILAVSLVLTVALAGCSKTETQTASMTVAPVATGKAVAAAETAAPKAEKVTLKIAMFDSNSEFIDYLTKKVQEYNKVDPNVSVEVEGFKSTEDYLKTMKVRLSANELPDLMELKPNYLNDFKSELLPLDDLSITAKNKYAKKYAIDGKILGMPSVTFPELVYYHPSIFKELNLTVPTTWKQYLDLLTAIKTNNKYIPYAMGGKDGWPVYPFNEFMHQVSSGDENYLSTIATQDNPFAVGTPFDKAYTKIDSLYKLKVMGPDPLGVSIDQAQGLFESKKAAVTALGLWYLSSYVAKVGNTDDLAAFPLPIRDTEAEPLKVMTFTDHFYAISKKSKNVETAKKFMEWFYSPAVYQSYLDFVKLDSAFEGVTANVPFLKKFIETNKFEAFTYVPGNDAYTKLINATHLDWKILGQDMIAGKKLADIEKELNEKWAKARK